MAFPTSSILDYCPVQNDTKRIGDIHYSLTSTGAIVQTKYQAEQECYEVHNGRLPIMRDARNMDQMSKSKTSHIICIFFLRSQIIPNLFNGWSSTVIKDPFRYH